MPDQNVAGSAIELIIEKIGHRKDITLDVKCNMIHTRKVAASAVSRFNVHEFLCEGRVYTRVIYDVAASMTARDKFFIEREVHSLAEMSGPKSRMTPL